MTVTDNWFNEALQLSAFIAKVIAVSTPVNVGKSWHLNFHERRKVLIISVDYFLTASVDSTHQSVLPDDEQ